MVFSSKPHRAVHDERRLPSAGALIRTSGPSVQFLSVSFLGLLGALALIWSGDGGIVPPGLLSGAAFYTLAVCIALWALRKSYPFPAIGWCNTVTLFRLMLVSVLISWLVVPPTTPWAVFAVASVAFLLDGVDGWLARREGYVSEFGARFDMEVDSVLALVLALHAVLAGSVGLYVILLGLPRYAFFFAQFAFPWISGDLPDRFSRKVVCVLQIAVLIFLLGQVMERPVSDVMVLAAASAVIWSFWVDLRWLWRVRS